MVAKLLRDRCSIDDHFLLSNLPPNKALQSLIGHS